MAGRRLRRQGAVYVFDYRRADRAVPRPHSAQPSRRDLPTCLTWLGLARIRDLLPVIRARMQQRKPWPPVFILRQAMARWSRAAARSLMQRRVPGVATFECTGDAHAVARRGDVRTRRLCRRSSPRVAAPYRSAFAPPPSVLGQCWSRIMRRRVFERCECTLPHNASVGVSAAGWTPHRYRWNGSARCGGGPARACDSPGARCASRPARSRTCFVRLRGDFFHPDYCAGEITVHALLPKRIRAASMMARASRSAVRTMTSAAP